MATRFKSVIAFLAAVPVVATAACASEPPAPTPKIEATVEAGIAATLVGVEIEKGVKATMAAPDAAIEHQNRSDTYTDLGAYENAIREYDKAIQLDPNYAHAYLNRGYSYNELGEGWAEVVGGSDLWVTGNAGGANKQEPNVPA